jgi:hypothetical protein
MSAEHNNKYHDESTHELARRQSQRGARILPERPRRWWDQCSLALWGLGCCFLVLGWRYLEGQIRGQLAEEQGRRQPWAEQRAWPERVREMALRRLPP